MVRQISLHAIGANTPAEHPLRDVNTPTKYAKEPEPVEHPLRDKSGPTKYAKEPEPAEHPLRDKSGPTKYAKEPEPSEGQLPDGHSQGLVPHDGAFVVHVNELETEMHLAQDSRRFTEAAIKQVMDFAVELADRYVPNEQQEDRAALLRSILQVFGRELYAANLRLTESTYKLADISDSNQSPSVGER
jgi:hypothetical protein